MSDRINLEASEEQEKIEGYHGLIDIANGTANQENAAASKKQWSKIETDMVRLCNGLSVPSTGFETSIEQWLKDLDQYISNYDRLLYSSISNYIYGLNDEQYGDFSTNIDSVYERATGKCDDIECIEKESYEKRKRFVIKLHDHVNLAHQQFMLYSQKQADLEAQIERKIEPELARTSKELTSQLIGLVAIFTALSFIVFGGISSLESLFSALSQSKDSVLSVIVIAVAWAFCLMNLLLAFMYFILRIIGNRLNITEKEGSIVQRYPLVFISNYIMVSAFMLSLGAWAASVTGVGRGIYNYALKHGDATFVFILVVIIAIIISLGCLIYKSLKNGKHK